MVAVARHLGVDPSEMCDLSASSNPVAPDVSALLRGDLDRLAHYPDHIRATVILAEAIGVDVSRLVVTNGGAEAIALVAALEPVGWVEPPEFSLYERHLASLAPSAPRWRSNPSCPLGELAAPADEAGVWDEAYWPLATGTWTRGDEVWRLGSLTKLWACLGLRIGYAIAPDDLAAQRLRKLQPRWSVNALALAAIERLVPVTDLAAWSLEIRRRRDELVEMLVDRGIDRLDVRDTSSNWVLVHRPTLRDELITQRVLVRDCASFGLDGWHRIAVPDDRGFDRLDTALATVLRT